MNAYRVSVALASLLIVLSFPGLAAGQTPPPARTGEVILKFKGSVTPAEREAILADLGAQDVKSLHPIAAHHARLSTMSVDEAVRRYRGNSKIEFIEPNYIYHAFAVPNDPRFGEMWPLLNNGQTGGVPGADIRATLAWDVTTGSPSVRVAIIDTGVDYAHPDLAANVFVNAGEVAGNGLDDDGNGFVDDVRGWDFVNRDNDPRDDHGHGTHVSGTVAAVGDNGVGIVGVNWRASIMPLKFLDASGSGNTADAVNAIDYATRMGARVINASWGGGGFSEALRLSIQSAGQAGVIFVAAAGNSGNNNDVIPAYPASYDLPNIVSVAATDHADQVPPWSNYGLTSVDLGAPGVDVLSTLPFGSYGLASGTSMAAPHVSGTMGLIFARFPGMQAEEAKTLLLARVDPIPSLAGRVLTGGRLNAVLAISDPDEIPPGPISGLVATDVQGTRVTLRWTATGDDGAIGRAARYEIRFATFPIDADNFGLGTLVPNPPRPATAGTAEEFRVTDLEFATSYYFALRALDEFGNPSPISNVATATTLGPPDVGVAPSSLAADLLTGQQVTQILTVSNTGVSELNFRLGIRNTAPPVDSGGSGAARVLRTFPIPAVSPATAVPSPPADAAAVAPAGDDPPSGYPLRTTPYGQGFTSTRPPLEPGQIRVGGVLGGSLRLLLLESNADLSEIRPLLASFPDVATVDVFNGLAGVPTLPLLASYDAVIVVINSPLMDPFATGDVLADYVDGGGGVVLTLASFIAGWDIRGRLASGGYMPYALGSGPIGSANMGSFDASHPIMADVDSVTGHFLGAVSLAPEAELVASWDNGQPFVATRGRVVGANVFIGAPGTWSGDVPLLLHNAAVWSGGVAWLSADPTSGVVPAGGQLGIVVAFDATGLDGGNYTASLALDSDDPDESEIVVPVQLHVTGVADIAIEGDLIVVESVQDFFVSRATTRHHLPVTVPPPGPGILELVADGDFGFPGEDATVVAEGRAIGVTNPVGADCAPARGRFPLSASDLALLLADGALDVEVINGPFVDPICAVNRHTVRLEYASLADRVDFGGVFLGAAPEMGIRVTNAGTDLLTLTSITTSGPPFTVTPSSFALAPGASRRVVITFRPELAQSYSGTLTLRSDDPDESEIVLPLLGLGLIPPDVAVSPPSFDETLITGATVARTLTIANQGGSDLTFGITLEAEASAFGLPVLPTSRKFAPAEGKSGEGAGSALSGAPGGLEQGPPRSDSRAPYAPALLPPSTMSNATVLLVQDAQPWGTMSNETLLQFYGISYDAIPTTMLASTNLFRYQKVIVASDQPTSAYVRLAAQAAQLSGYVEAGGVLEFHAAGWGYWGGDASLVTLPGGMLIAHDVRSTNWVLDPSHPLMAGVPSPMTGNAVSHAYFLNVPGGKVLAMDDYGRSTLVVYQVGLGTVIAGGQTYELGYATFEHSGIILGNMIPYGFVAAARWLSANPLMGRVPAGEVAEVALNFDASGLLGGDYDAHAVVRTNDPDEGEIRVPVHLHVEVAPDIAVTGAPVMLESALGYQVSGATTVHPLAIQVPPGGGATLELEADGDYGDFFETATVTVEGTRLGEVGRVGSDCLQAQGQFTLSAADLARAAADESVFVEVQNSFDVDAFCLLNQHRVVLRYAGNASPTDIGTVFVGHCGSQVVVVTNAGTATLNVTSVAASGAGFQVAGGGFALPPGGQQELTVSFCPTVPGVVNGTLEIRSDDPDEGVVQIALRGEGLIPPDIATAPQRFDENLLSGQVVTRTLTIDNLGGSELTFDLLVQPAATDSQPAARVAANVTRVERAIQSASPTVSGAAASKRGPEKLASAYDRSAVVTEGVPGGLELDPPRSDQMPPNYRWLPVSVSIMNGAEVLLIQDAPPWGTASNEQILLANGISFDIVPSAGVAGVDLGRYRKVIVASDQPTATYDLLRGRLAQLSEYVNRGGTLEFHAAGWGWQQGDLTGFTLPGGPRVWPGLGWVNLVLDPTHPLVAGVPNPFQGNAASHAYFSDVPTDAEVIVSDDAGRINLIAYRFGAGLVIASGQTLEFGVAFGEPSGTILRNMLPYGFGAAISWLAVSPEEGRVGPGGRAEITLRLDATDLVGGDYGADIVVRSNDPDEQEVRVPVRMHVTGVPDISLAGGMVSLESTQPVQFSGARTTHELAVDVPVATGGVLELVADGDYGDFVETATATMEGIRLGQVGRVGADCLTARDSFPIDPADLIQVAADGVVRIEVQNSFEVDVFCPLNQHHVVLRYRGVGDLLDFGPVFVGQCRSLSLEVMNQGTETLNVISIEASGPFQVAPIAFSLPPQGRQELTVSFCPLATGIVEGTLRIRSDDPDEAELVSTLRGEGRVPPDIAVAPTELREARLVGQAGSRQLLVANHGGWPLTFRIELEEGSTPETTGVARVASALSLEQRESARARYSSYATDVASAGLRTSEHISAAALAPATRRAAAPAWVPSENPYATTIFFDDMESGVNGWSHYSTHVNGVDQWAQTTQRASSGLRSWAVAQHLYEGGDALQTPAIDLSGHAQASLSFQHWYQFDDCFGNPGFEPDGGIVEVSEIGTNVWQQITPVGGYPYVLDDICGNPLAGRQAYSHGPPDSTGGFVSALFDLTPFAGKRILIRFHAGWDCGNCGPNEGWYVDDVRVFAESPPWLSVTPDQGVIPPGGVMEVAVGLDASGLAAGEYEARLKVLSDDPDEPEVVVPIRLFVADLPATADLNPATLNLGRRGNFITGYLELTGGVDPATVDLASVRLNLIAPADSAPRIGDEDGDGVPDLTLKFPFELLRPTLSPGDPVRMVVTGEVSGATFLAEDSIRVARHEVLSPQGGEEFTAGSTIAIGWSVPVDWTVAFASLYWSYDAGVTWTMIATDVQGTSYSWTVPDKKTSHALVRVDLYDADGLLASDASDGTFSITEAVTAAGGSESGGIAGGLRCAPNPFGHAGTDIGFALATPGEVELSIYSAAGRRLRTLARGWRPAGRHQVRWDGRDEGGVAMGSGVYFCRLRGSGLLQTRRMTLLR